MNALVRTTDTSLPALVDRAANALSNARSAAEILDARDRAGVAYTAAKLQARLAKAKKAHDDLIAAAYRAQADALDIEAQAKRRLADEYDAAQERGEVVGRKGGGDTTVPVRNAATAADVGLTRKQIHEAREIRDAEKEEPGVVRRVLDEAVRAGEEPTRAKVARAVKSKSKRKKPSGRKSHPDAPQESEHDRDLRMLQGIWEIACVSARDHFFSTMPAVPSPKRGKDAVRVRVLEAVSALAGLPSASEVAGYFDDQDVAVLVREKLPAAVDWSNHFASVMKVEDAQAVSVPINHQVNKLTSELTGVCDRLEQFVDKRGEHLDADGFYSIFQHIELVVKQLQALAYGRMAQRLQRIG